MNKEENASKKEEEEVIKIVEEISEMLLKRIVPPHKKKSKEVTNDDMDRIVEEAKVLYALCFQPVGIYKGSFAVHHSQIDDKDPLNFFVTYERKIVINLEIVKHSNYEVDSKESCLTFSQDNPIMIKRWQKIEVIYVTIMVDPDNKDKFRLSSAIKESLSGKDAFVFQHEFDHSEPKYIY
ncbi:MAG TPA: hypothetical protein ENH99_01500 [Candidatus Pacearchaeota archaeon]|nr:hypothetical protein [Candidatus Pacearchaeota archaeon]